MSFGNQINYKQLLDRHKHIRVPQIQRDYAQGRPAEKEVRESFLMTLKDALDKPADDQSLPLNLDFIYGSVEGEGMTRFLPLDGQQRLTTLFLLHWYLAWKDDQWASFAMLFVDGARARFAYSVRQSSNEFFDQLVNYRPTLTPGEVSSMRPDGKGMVSEMITDQPWYFRNWRLDPTIQAVLNMFDAIHEKFRWSTGKFTRLLSEDQPAITFQLLDLENFGLSDDLYIKMNARGKPLTPFETFKARYEQDLIDQLPGETFLIGDQAFGVSEYIARRMDTTWADLFWEHRSSESDLYDEAFMNVFRAIALVTRDPESSKYLQDFSKLRIKGRPPSYSDFHSYNWLDSEFTRTLMSLLDSWCGSSGVTFPFLTDDEYLNERTLLEKVILNGANLSYTDLAQFLAYVLFIKKHQGKIDQIAFQEWVRIIRNLALNSDYNRPDDFRRSARGIMRLLEHSGDILSHLASDEETAAGFSELQLSEEKMKAQLLQADDDWRELIVRAELHGYFRGQIGFLLDFSGVFEKSSNSEVKAWEASDHAVVQAAFNRHLNVAEVMFSPTGLADIGEYRWQRALLSIGDYLLSRGRNRSFLVNSSAEEASWKRLLSGTGSRGRTPRNILKALFNKLTPEEEISGQLDDIVAETKDVEAWREEIVKCPSALGYCDSKSIRVDERDHIYLLKRTQMNGAHAELFTYCLYDKLRRGDIELSCFSERYVSVNDTYTEPHLWLRCHRKNLNMVLKIEPSDHSEKYIARVSEPGDDPVLVDLLKGVGFEEKNSLYQLLVERLHLEDLLREVDATINAHVHEKNATQ